MADIKVYYTEGIKIVNLPAYLDEQYVNYKIIIENRVPVTGVLNSSRTIPAISGPDKNIKVTLILLVQDIELNEIKLSILDGIKTKEVSLKSTVSETCMDEENVCTFELKLKIYMIDKKSNKAVLLNLNRIEKIAKERNLTTGLYIKRRSGGISKTSKDTIDKINNPDKLTNKYIKYALAVFKNQCNTGATDFPRLLYRDLIKSVFENFLKNTNDPDSVVDDIGSIFGQNIEVSYMKSELLAFFHIYEALVPATSTSPGYDKVQHFTYCVKKMYNTTAAITDAAQYAGEAYDLVTGGSWDDTLSDMEANNLGQAYGKELYERYHPVRAALRNLG
ncbi:hypothetical protein AC423_001314 [Salmonella enterica subsp. enterica]|nr:hypothetical protein [Salmonella enterica subsp. enterica]